MACGIIPIGGEAMVDEGQILRRCEDLERDLERSDVRVSALLRRAMALAELVDDDESRRLFEMHLSGQQRDRSGPGLATQPLPAATNRDVVEAFIDDRRLLGTADQVMAYPMEQIEAHLAGMQDVLDTVGAGASLGAEKYTQAVEYVTQLGAIIGSVRNRIALFVARVQKSRLRPASTYLPNARNGAGGLKVFIGHGRSKLWEALRGWLTTKGLQWDEFNRAPTAGIPTAERLKQMLDEAAMALLVMTAEDEHGDGKRHARENVIHEVGLFQGRLGFLKAIILLEEGCEEFSNIAGLGQIRFVAGDIESALEEVERVLVREGLLKTTGGPNDA
jgi:predicted nucleotide-binding protein